MLKAVVAVAMISLIANQSFSAEPITKARKSNTHLVGLKEQKKFDPQKLIGLSLDTVRMFFASIGRVTEESQGGETHFHVLSADSLSRGIRPSEADAIVGKNGTRTFTAYFYKLPPEALKKFSGHDFAGGKILSFTGELDYPNMLAHVEMNANTGMFSMACRAK
ncbi:MAG: hypothetical protein Q8922_15770 [Bacteroidota bacterium]|nr:hypothetical protein [Bacteroidota bacterium]MDP4232763.1 hypothetical protein [Bacteroidota bacterium]MDP4242555.1 hypothetical protein [Bacteroidota bacterium]MDP4289372.1 hypothetical protein [Bacteroidota bacterium]